MTGSWSGALTVCRIAVQSWGWRDRQCPRIAGGMSPWGESDTRAKLIDPGLHACGWTEDLIRREETAGAVEIVDGRPRPPRHPAAHPCPDGTPSAHSQERPARPL